MFTYFCNLEWYDIHSSCDVINVYRYLKSNPQRLTLTAVPIDHKVCQIGYLFIFIVVF